MKSFERWVAHHGVLFWIALVVIAAIPGQIPAIGPLIYLIAIVWGVGYQLTVRRRHLAAPGTGQQLGGAPGPQPPRPDRQQWQSRSDTRSSPSGSPSVNVVGTRYYKGWGGRRGAGSVTLVRQPGNPHDSNAVAVFVGAEQIGNLPREQAALIAPLFDASGQARVGAKAHFGDNWVSVTVPDFAKPNLAPAASAPFMEPMEPWGRSVNEFEIAFESEHRTEVAAVFLDHGVALTADGVVVDGLTATLALSEHPTAPAVVIGSHWVGNVTDPQFAPYLPALARLASGGRCLAVVARVWARNDAGTTRSNVRIYLPALNEIEPPGPMPEGLYVLLPHGRRVQVTQEELHLAEVSRLLAGSPQQPAVATLHLLPSATGKSKERVQVRIYGEVVGVLTAHMAEHFTALLRACEEEGVTVACHAIVKGNHLKADVELDTARAGDLDDDWISKHLYGAVLQRDAETIAEAAADSDVE